MQKKKAHLPTFGILAVLTLALTVIGYNVKDASYFMAQTRNAVTDQATLNTVATEVHTDDGVHTGELPSVIINRYGYDDNASPTDFIDAPDNDSEQKQDEEALTHSESNLEFLGIDVGNIESRVTDTSFVQTETEKNEEDIEAEEANDLVAREDEDEESSGQVLGVEDTQQQDNVSDHGSAIYVDEVVDTRDIFEDNSDIDTYREYSPDDEVYDYCESEDCAF